LQAAAYGIWDVGGGYGLWDACSSSNAVRMRRERGRGAGRGTRDHECGMAGRAVTGR
jgi:hypothetical protein